jgi:glutathione synthase/RimK-type ligase-like ATP-grasp enzyme
MKVLLIGGRSFNAEDTKSYANYVQYLKETLGGEADVSGVYIDHLVLDISMNGFSMDDPSNPSLTAGMDLLFIRPANLWHLRAPAYYISSYAEQAGIRCINDFVDYYPGTKVAQAIVFKRLGVPFLRTLYCMDKTRLVAAAKERLGFPFILKAGLSSHGFSNYLIRTDKEAAETLEQIRDIEFVAQEFCPNDRDYRFLLFGDRALLFERRAQEGTHLNNTSQGGLAQELPESSLPSAITTQSRLIAKTLKLAIAGIDIIPNTETGRYYFLEVNTNPQLRNGALLEEKRALLRALLHQPEAKKP